jgi:hypothetical protein
MSVKSSGVWPSDDTLTIGQQEVREIVHGKRELVTIRARLTLRPADGRRVVDQQIEAVVPLADLRREGVDTRERCEVGAIEHGVAAGGAYRTDDFVAALLVAAVHDHACTERAELTSDFLAEAVRGARHEGSLPGQPHAHASPTLFVLGRALRRRRLCSRRQRRRSECEPDACQQSRAA